jgi:P27 family predicted phage terminase small subunit
MSKPGVKKKPTALKKIKGTLRKDRTLPNEMQPETISLYPPAPVFLGDAATKEWELIIPQIVDLGILAKVDMAMITAYCIEWGTYIEAERQLQDEGRMTHAANGTVMQHPLNNLKNAALKQAIKLATEFGFTPSSRTSIGAPQKEKKDPFEELLKQANGGK